MDFARLPDYVFLQILEYFRLEEFSRFRRVNKSFQRISEMAISRTKSLHLDEDRFRNLKEDQFVVILNLCSPNLEKVRFPNDKFNGNFEQPHPTKIQLATTLASYQCPRLKDINLGDADIDFAVFHELFQNNPSIESLVWDVSHSIEFPDVVSNGLKKLHFRNFNDATLESMINRCPNLQELHLLYGDGITPNVLDEFFGSTQQLHRLYLHSGVNQSVIEEMVTFWNLPLTSLSMFSFGEIVEGDVLHKVVTSFPHLQKLEMRLTRLITIGALAALQELEFLALEIPMVSATDEHDLEIRKLVTCKQLRNLSLHSSIITAGTFITMFRCCHKLEYLDVSLIVEAETPEEAAVILGSLSGISKRDITIDFFPFNEDIIDWHKFIWESEPVKEVITNLEQNEGLKVKIGFWENGETWYNIEEVTE